MINLNFTKCVDLGIQLDYESHHLFKPINPTTTNDLHVLTFDRPILAKSPSRSAAHLYNQLLRLPSELCSAVCVCLMLS